MISLTVGSMLGLIGLYHISIFSILCFPGWGPQWLSYLWYLSDGRIRRKSLTWTHILHLGIFKRWAQFVSAQQRQFDSHDW